MTWLRALALVTSGIALFAAAPFLVYPSQSDVAIDFDTGPPRRTATGFYPGERTAEGLTFAWTQATFGLILPGLDRAQPWTVTIRLRAGRPDGTTVELRPAIDGIALPPITLVAADFSERTLTLTPRANRARDASIAFQVSPTFTPGPADPRELGVQVDWIRLHPAGRPTLAARALPPIGAGAVSGAVVAVLGLPFWLAAVGLAGLSVAVAAVITQGLGPFVPFPWTPILISAAITTGLTVAALPRASAGVRLVAGLTFGAVIVKLLILFHPGMPVGDALFHAHRFQDVLAGKYLFTSIAPGEYAFPYAIGLYVFAALFEGFTSATFDNVALLRAIVVSGDAFAAALLYRLVVRWRADQIAAVGAVVAYHLLPLSFGVITTGNLTNVFSQSLAMITLVAAARTIKGPLAIAGVAALASAAFLSHTGTFAVLSVQLLATSAVLALTGDAERRRTGMALAIATAAAIVLAVGLYYAYFLDVYRDAFSRITAETGRATLAAGGRTPSMRLADVPRLFGLYYTWPGLAVAAFGLWGVIRDRQDRSVTRITIAAWLVVCGLFLVVGIITPVDMRHYLAALPIVAVLVGVGLSGALRWASHVRASR